MTQTSIAAAPATDTWSQDELIPALLTSGVIDEAAVSAALSRQSEERAARSLVYHLIAAGALPAAHLLTQAQHQFPGIETIDLGTRPPRTDSAGLLSRDTAQRLRVLPLFRSGNVLHVAVGEPYPLEVLQELQVETGSDVRPLMADDYHLTQALLSAYPQNESVDTLLGEAAREAAITTTRASASEAIEKVVAAARVPQAVTKILRDGVQLGASDIHIEWGEGFGRVRYRRDGHLMGRAERIPIEVRSQFVNRIKVLAHMNTAQDRVPDNGHLEIAFEKDGPKVHFRVSTLPTVTGEKVVLRIQEHTQVRRRLEDIGMTPEQVAELRDAGSRRDRMVLVTGPTGSGKTTTLYSLLQDIASPTLNIVTIEDPVELHIEWINQVNIQGRPDEADQTRLTFASVLMNVLRQDPDIIMVGEIRDLTTAQTAVRAAITGHRVLSTLHTPDTVTTIARLRGLGLEPYAVADSVEIIIAQRLVRRICDNCRADAPPLSPVQIQQAKVDPAWAAAIRPSAGRGCHQCNHTGFRGRTGVFEFLRLDSPLRRAVAENRTPDHLRELARASGLVALRESGMHLVARGMTTIDEVLSETPDPA